MGSILLLPVTLIVAIFNFLLIHILLGWLWLLIFLFRQIAIVTAKFRKDFDKILPWLDIVMWDDYSKNHRGAAPIAITLDGDISAEEFKKLFQSNVLQARNPQTNQLKFSELKQYQSYWLGFLFWRKDTNFNINNHIQEVFADEDPSLWHKMDQIGETFALKPYIPKTSPWEIIIVRNFKNEAESDEVDYGRQQTMVFWRFHHSMADGFAVVSILVNSLGQSPNTSSKPSVLSKPSQTSLVQSVLTILQFPLAVFRMQMHILQNFWFKYTKVDRKGSGKVTYRFSKKIPLHQVKALAKKYNVRVSAVPMAIIAENLSKILEPTTSHFYATYAMPVPNHPGTLTNHAQIGTLSVPVGVEETILTRMQKINDYFLSLKSDPVPMVINYFGFIAGSVFPRMTKFGMELGSYTPVALTNFSFGDGFSIAGRECTSFVGFATPYEHVLDSMIAIIGYRDHVIISCGADDRFLAKHEVSKLVAGFAIDFERLAKDSGV